MLHLFDKVFLVNMEFSELDLSTFWWMQCKKNSFFRDLNGYFKAMYKTRNTGTGNGIRGMLYSGKCRPTFWGMSPKVSGNVLKQSRE